MIMANPYLSLYKPIKWQIYETENMTLYRALSHLCLFFFVSEILKVNKVLIQIKMIILIVWYIF